MPLLRLTFVPLCLLLGACLADLSDDPSSGSSRAPLLFEDECGAGKVARVDAKGKFDGCCKPGVDEDCEVEPPTCTVCWCQRYRRQGTRFTCDARQCGFDLDLWEPGPSSVYDEWDVEDTLNLLHCAAEPPTLVDRGDRRFGTGYYCTDIDDESTLSYPGRSSEWLAANGETFTAPAIGPFRHDFRDWTEVSVPYPGSRLACQRVGVSTEYAGIVIGESTPIGGPEACDGDVAPASCSGGDQNGPPESPKKDMPDEEDDLLKGDELVGDPVSLRSGAFLQRHALLEIPAAVGPALRVQLAYRSTLAVRGRSLGHISPGWTASYTRRLIVGEYAETLPRVARRVDEVGSVHSYVETERGSGRFENPWLDSHVEQVEGAYRWVVDRDGDGGAPPSAVEEYDDQLGRLMRVSDRAGNALVFTYAQEDGDWVERITREETGDTLERVYEIVEVEIGAEVGAPTLVERPRLVQIRDGGAVPEELRRVVTLGYDADGDLDRVVDAAGNETRYVVDAQHRITDVFDENQGFDLAAPHLQIEYGAGPTAHRVARQTLSTGGSLDFDWRGARDRVDDDDVGVESVRVVTNAGRPDERSVEYELDEDRRIERVRTPATSGLDAAAFESRSYRHGLLHQRRMPEGRQVLTERDREGRLRRVRVEGTAGRVAEWTMEYDREGRLISARDPVGREERLEYDAASGALVASERIGLCEGECAEPPTLRTEYGVDARGRTIWSRGPDGATHCLFYAGGRVVRRVPDAVDASCPAGVASALGVDERWSYDARGQLRSHVGLDGVETRYTRDGEGRITEQVVDPGGRAIRTTFEYVGHGRLHRRVDDADGQAIVTEYEWAIAGSEESHLLHAVTSALGTPAELRTEMTYDAHGELDTLSLVGVNDDGSDRVLQRSMEPIATGWRETLVSPLGHERVREYDHDRRLVAEVDERGVRTEYAHDIFGITGLQRGTADVVDGGVGVTGEAERWVFTHFDDGRLRGRFQNVSGGGWSEFLDYDPFGRLAERRTASEEDEGVETRFERDDTRRSVRVIAGPNTDAPRVTLEERDALGRLRRRVVDPDGEARTTRFEYDGPGTDRLRLRALVRPSGTTRYDYTSLGGLAEVVDAMGQRWSMEDDWAGRNVVVVDPMGARIETRYDASGRPLLRTTDAGAPGAEAERWSWTRDGQLRSRTDMGGKATTYLRDADGRVAGIRYADGSEVSFTRLPNGLVTRMDDPNGSTTYRYDHQNQLLERTRVPSGAGTEQTVLYDYEDRSGLLRTMRYAGELVRFRYDERHRPRRVRWRRGSSNWDASYARDDVGRILRETRRNHIHEVHEYAAGTGELEVMRYETNPPLEFAITSRDAEGRRLAWSTPGGFGDASYDELGRIESLFDPAEGAARYTYDARGNRLADQIDPAGPPLGSMQLYWHEPTTGDFAYWTLESLDALDDELISDLDADFHSPVPGWTLVGAGQIDGAAGRDLVWRENAGERRLAVWFLGEDGRTLRSQFLRLPDPDAPMPGDEWQLVSVTDVDGDEVADLVWGNAAGQVALWPLAFDGEVSVAGGVFVEAVAGPGWELRGAGPLGDGAYGLFWQSRDAARQNVAWVLSQDAPTVLLAGHFLTATPSSEILGAGDADGDGMAELLFRELVGEHRLALWTLSRFGTDVAHSGGWFLETPLSDPDWVPAFVGPVTAPRPAMARSYDAVGRDLGLAYDDAGNLLYDGEHSYAYDAANRLIRVEGPGIGGEIGMVGVVHYRYDGVGNLVAMNVNGEESAIVVDEREEHPRVLAVLHPNHGRRYVYGAGGLAFWGSCEVPAGAVGAESCDGSVGEQRAFSARIALRDTRGSVYQLGGADVNGYEAVPPMGVWGEPSPAGDVGMNGEWHGPDGSVWLRARHYHPGLGRFLQRDPYVGTPGRPSSLNRYTYVENDPLQYVDPSGLDKEGGPEDKQNPCTFGAAAYATCAQQYTPPPPCPPNQVEVPAVGGGYECVWSGQAPESAWQPDLLLDFADLVPNQSLGLLMVGAVRRGGTRRALRLHPRSFQRINARHNPRTFRPVPGGFGPDQFPARLDSDDVLRHAHDLATRGQLTEVRSSTATFRGDIRVGGHTVPAEVTITGGGNVVHFTPTYRTDPRFSSPLPPR